jgi:hypothetical protein
MRPMVVIENPAEDPTILAIGNVEVIELSSHPISRYGDVTDIVDTGYEEECIALLSRVIGTYNPLQRGEVGEHLCWMLSEIKRLKRKYGEYDEAPEEDQDADLEEAVDELRTA